MSETLTPKDLERIAAWLTVIADHLRAEAKDSDYDVRSVLRREADELDEMARKIDAEITRTCEPRTAESVRHAFEETYSAWGHTITDPKAAAWAAWCAAGSRYSQPGTWPVLPRESTCRRQRLASPALCADTPTAA